MARKSKEVKEIADKEADKIRDDFEKTKKKLEEEAEKAAKRLREIEATLLAAEEEEKQMVARTETTIDEACKAAGMFCGVTLTKDDLLNVIKLAIETGQNVKIPYKLYFNE